MTLQDAKDAATVVGIAIGVLTYLTNSYFQFRNKRVENLKRYFDARDKLFNSDGFLMNNIRELESGTYVRKLDDVESEKKFNAFLGYVEEIAYLTRYGAVPTRVQVYLFGWFARKIRPHITKEERENVFWELAIHYIDELAKAADDYLTLPHEKRDRYLKKNTLVYKKYS
jgi:hypothetical protein